MRDGLQPRGRERVPGTRGAWQWLVHVVVVQDGPGWDEQHVCGMCGVLFDTVYPLGAHAWTMP